MVSRQNTKVAFRQRAPNQPAKKRAPAGAMVGINTKALTRQARPAMAQTNYRIKGREMIGTILGLETTLQVFKFSLAPTSGHFPRLSILAPLWETFDPHSMTITVESNGGTQRGGAVVVCIDEDPSDSAPDSRQIAMTYKDSDRFKAWENGRVRTAFQSVRRPLWTGRNSTETLGRQTSPGNVFVLVEGLSADISFDVFVDYDITLMTPQNPAALAEAAQSTSFVTSASGGNSQSGVSSVQTEKGRGFGAWDNPTSAQIAAGAEALAKVFTFFRTGDFELNELFMDSSHVPISIESFFSPNIGKTGFSNTDVVDTNKIQRTRKINVPDLEEWFQPLVNVTGGAGSFGPDEFRMTLTDVTKALYSAF